MIPKDASQDTDIVNFVTAVGVIAECGGEEGEDVEADFEGRVKKREVFAIWFSLVAVVSLDLDRWRYGLNL
jgi:hypothetical protein